MNCNEVVGLYMHVCSIYGRNVASMFQIQVMMFLCFKSITVSQFHFDKEAHVVFIIAVNYYLFSEVSCTKFA